MLVVMRSPVGPEMLVCAQRMRSTEGASVVEQRVQAANDLQCK